MLQLTPQSKIFLAVQAIDLRKGIDGIAALCRQKLNIDPLSGAVFIFKNRLQTTLKILCYDGQGYWLCTKRLSSGKFQWWPKNDTDLSPLTYQTLYTLLWNGNPSHANFGSDWRRLTG